MTSRARRRKARARERGVALVLVIGAITMMATMFAEFQEETGAEFAAALSSRDSVQAEYNARSALNLGRLILSTEPTMRKGLAPIFIMMKRTPPQLPIWEYADLLLGAFNSGDSADGFARVTSLDMTGAKNIGLKTGRFELQIVDEDSKINVNGGGSNVIAHMRLAQQLMAHMAPPNYNPLFEARDVNGDLHDRFTICSAILDWADMDEQAFNCNMSAQGSVSGGIEDTYYALLKKPYKRKNAPFDSLEELRLVRGMSDRFWGTFIDPDPTNPKKRNLTVWGQGAINVNSANAATILSIVCSGAVPNTELCTNPAQMASFVSTVSMAKAFSMGAPLFGSPREFINTLKGKGMLGPMLTGMGIKPVTFTSDSEFAKSLSTESKVFSIYAVGVAARTPKKKEGETIIPAPTSSSDGPPPPPRPPPNEARIRVHAVIDMRPPDPSASGITTPPPASTTSSSSAATPLTAQSLASGGQLVYFRIE